MAPRRSNAAPAEEAGQKRIRRSDDQLIRDLQEKIEELRKRSAAKELKSSPTIRGALKALRAIDRAASAAESSGDTELRHVLADARGPLASHLEGQGLRIPKSRRPKGPRPKTAME